VPVDFCVSVDLKGFVRLVDQLGGVDFDVPIDMDYDDPYQDLHIHFKKGMQHLDGQQALEVVRFRHNNDGTGYGTEDIGRIGTQQAFLKAVAQKLLKLENIPAMAEVFLKYVKTDLTLGNLVWLGNEALSMGGTDALSFATLPGDGTGWYKGMSVYALEPDAALTMVNAMLNPYVDDIAAGDMNILIP
jgi:polyisoprenyl-teichoic acid--peptidoglycan teichoic acid transferase